MNGKKKNRWTIIKGQELTEMDRIILAAQERGKLVPTRSLIKTPEQIEGIRRAGVVNTGILDMLTDKIHAGMCTQDIDDLVAEYTAAHGATSACLGYDGFPRSCCTSVNEVVCHGIPNEWEVLEDGDIINVDCTTILDGYYADASRMYVVGGRTAPQWQKLVDVAWECLKIGEEVCSKPYVYVGDIGNAIQKHARKNGFSVVRDLSGHGTGLQFHEDPDVDHYGHKGTGMLLVPGMVFTIEPMINMGTYEVFCDEEDGWTVVTEDELPSAQWEHTFVMTEHGVEVLTH